MREIIPARPERRKGKGDIKRSISRDRKRLIPDRPGDLGGPPRTYGTMQTPGMVPKRLGDSQVTQPTGERTLKWSRGYQESQPFPSVISRTSRSARGWACLNGL